MTLPKLLIFDKDMTLARDIALAICLAEFMILPTTGHGPQICNQARPGLIRGSLGLDPGQLGV